MQRPLTADGRRAGPRLRFLDRGPGRVTASRILPVEDRPLLLRAYRRVLSSEVDADVAAEADPRIAVGRAIREAFDAVVLDYHMPQLSGLDAFRAIVERKPAMRGRVIFITAADELQKRSLSEATGVPVLAKPFVADELQAAIRDILQPACTRRR